MTPAGDKEAIMKPRFNLKDAIVVIVQWLGASIGYTLSLTITSAVLPLSKAIADATPASGIVSLPAALLLAE